MRYRRAILLLLLCLLPCLAVRARPRPQPDPAAAILDSPRLDLWERLAVMDELSKRGRFAP